MSEGADLVPQVCENSLTTLKIEDDPELLPPRTISYNTRRPRFGTGNVPLSPYIIIDGKKLRSALALTKKRLPRRVSFPANDNLLVTGYLEPTNPWKFAENVNREDLISAYKESCKKHNTDPLEIVMSQLEVLNISDKYSQEFNLKGQVLDPNLCEPLEEIFKRIQFNKVNLEATSLNDESSVILFDMLEYYESTKQLTISSNPGIGLHGWQACASMIRKTQCLEQLEAKSVILNEEYMNILSRALRLVCHLHVLNLENCGLSGRSIVTLVAALKMNRGIRELYLADNGLDLYDAIQLGSLLRLNNHIQLLDISNNNIQDDGVRDILEGLINQINEDKDGKGLNILVLWNNQLTKKSSPYFARIIALSKTIETLNIGKNMLTDELLFIIKDALEKNRVLLQLGMQSIELTCDGILTLSEIIKINQILQRIDLRNNNIQMTGMKALSSAMKENRSITKIDLDDKPKLKVDDLTETLHQYTQLVAEIQVYCSRNEQNRIIEGSNEGSESSHHNNLCSTNSRKISLTCQTLPYSLPTMISIQNDQSGKSVLEPKRINGGRLRSPALSPNSSPITSPVPTPSRSRFVVSRVPETCSKNSTTPLSPAVALSPESPSIHLTSSASGSSRFRVSVVESASNMPLSIPVVTTSEADVTPGLNFKVNTKSTDSDGSSNEPRSKLEKDNDQNSYLISNVEDTCTSSVHEFDNIETLNTKKYFVEAIKTKLNDDINSVTSNNKECRDVQNNPINISTHVESTTSIEHIEDTENYCNEDIKNTKVVANANKANGSECTINDKSTTIAKEDVVKGTLTNTLLNERTKLQCKTEENFHIQQHSSNSEKLLPTFEDRTDLSSDSTSISELRSRNTFQDSIGSGMTSEDKFHYYLEDCEDVISNHGRQEPPVSLKNETTKSFAIFQLLSLKSLKNIFPSFKFMTNLNVSEQSNKSNSKTITQVSLLLPKNRKNDLTSIQKECIAHSSENKQLSVDIKRKETDGSPLDSQLSLQDKQSKIYVVLINKDSVLMANHIVSSLVTNSCFKFVNNVLLVHVLKKKMPLFTFTNTYEHFTLKATKNYIKNGNIQEILNKVGFILIKNTCDEALTNSINLISDNSPLFCSIMYDINNVSNMLTVYTFDRLHNFLILNLNEKNDENNFIFSADNKKNNLVRLTYNKRRDRNVNAKSLVCHNVLEVNVKTNCLLNSEVTKMYTVDKNNGKKAFTDMLRNNMEGINLRYDPHDSLLFNPMDWQSTIVNNIPEVGTLKMNFMYKDVNFDSSKDNTDLCTSIIYDKDINISRIQEVVKTFIIEDNKYFEASNVKETRINVPFMANAANSIIENTETMPLQKTYSCETVLNTFVPQNLIFSVAGNSTDGTLDERKFSSESIPNNCSSSATKLNTSFYDLPQIPHSSINLIIKKPENIHKDIEAFKLEEKNFPLNYNIQKSAHLYEKQKFKEDNHSRIDSECPSICAKTCSIAHSKRSLCSLEKNSVTNDNPSENMYILTKFGSNIAQHVKCTTPDAICDMTHKYFNTIKCAVATTICSKATINTQDDMTVEIISDKSTNVAKPSSVIHKTSTK